MTKHPPLPPVVESLMYAASMCTKQGKNEDALQLYDKVIGLMPDWAIAYYERGCVRYQTGDVHGAFKDLKYAFQLSPELEKKVTGLFNVGTVTKGCSQK